MEDKWQEYREQNDEARGKEGEKHRGKRGFSEKAVKRRERGSNKERRREISGNGERRRMKKRVGGR